MVEDNATNGLALSPTVMLAASIPACMRTNHPSAPSPA